MNRKQLLVLAAVAPFILSGCSYMPSWMGGKKDNKPKLEGERVAVLAAVDAVMQPDETLKDKAVTLPATNANEDWPQHTGMFSATSSNLAAPGAFDHEAHATAGEGEEFEQEQVVRPVVGGGLVYAMDAVGNISAHSASDITNVRWHSKGVAAEDEPQTGGGGLAYSNGKLYAVSGRGIVAALDATTGKEVWHKDMHVPFRSAPVVSSEKLYAITLDNQVFAINITNGDVAWNQRGIRETTGLMNAVSPLIAGDMLVVPYSSGEVYVMAAADGKEVWSDSLSAGKRTQGSSIFAGIGGDPVVDGGVVFAVNSGGALSVMSLATGQHAWDRPIGAINTPWVAGDFLFMLTTDNTLMCALKFDGRIRWSIKLPGYEDEAQKKRPITWKGPVMVDGKLAAVSSNGQMMLVSAADGKVLSTKSIPEGAYSAPVVAGGKMFFVTQSATLYSLQ